MLRLRCMLCSLSPKLGFAALSSAAEQCFKVDKEALKELRSRTGYSYVNCRKALCQFGNDKLEEAEKWLKQMAEKEGWNRATKLKSRVTRQGLVSAIAEGHRAALVRVYCETDFVARGKRFKDLVILSFLTRLWKLESLHLIDGTPASKVLRDLITEIGENIVVPPVTLIASQPEINLWSYAHPPNIAKNVYMGTFASVVGLEGKSKVGFPLEKLGRQLCQQIIGMKYVYFVLTNCVTQVDEKETQLLRQSFMLNPSQTVYDYINEHSIKVISFYRIELGEGSNTSMNNSA
uniref:Elongation factor Ts, mitochondrial n=1 Tax=Syphacia muris TaxID=451379 RepID=A0A0N5AET6_9BILA